MKSRMQTSQPMLPPAQGPQCSHLDPEVQVYFVLLLLLLRQFFVVLLLALGDALPAAANLHHALFQWQVVQLPVGQQLLGELLVTVPRRRGGARRIRTRTQPPSSRDPPSGQGGFRPSDSHGRLFRFSLELHFLGRVCSGWGCPHLAQLSLRGHPQGSRSLHPPTRKYFYLLPHAISASEMEAELGSNVLTAHTWVRRRCSKVLA